MKNTKNPILECPKCKKGLVSIGSKLERLHPVAKFISQKRDKILVIWFCAIPFMIYAMAVSLHPGDLRSLAVAIIGMVMAPPIFLACIERSFRIYRVTDCPYCGYHDEEELGFNFYA